MSIKVKTTDSTTGCGCFLLIMLINALIGIIAWPYTINSWLEYAGNEPQIVWWQGMILGLIPVFGEFTIPAAFATWILLMFLN